MRSSGPLARDPAVDLAVEDLGSPADARLDPEKLLRGKRFEFAGFEWEVVRATKLPPRVTLKPIRRTA